MHRKVSNLLKITLKNNAWNNEFTFFEIHRFFFKCNIDLNKRIIMLIIHNVIHNDLYVKNKENVTSDQTEIRLSQDLHFLRSSNAKKKY